MHWKKMLNIVTRVQDIDHTDQILSYWDTVKENLWPWLLWSDLIEGKDANKNFKRAAFV